MNTLGLKLQVRENEILTLRSTTFLNYVHLEYLILEGVRTLHGPVELPKSLVYLKWKDGLFTTCPVDFSGLEKLAVLELIDCKSMKLLPPCIVNAKKLVVLELEGCLSLTKLPVGLSRFLEHLGLNKTGVGQLPSDLERLTRLRHLEACATPLTRVPKGLSRLGMLSSLDLRHTSVTTLPDSIGGLKWLKTLNLCCSMVTSLPDTMGALQNLEILDLGGSRLGLLPESICGLQSLTTLQLWCTNLKSLPQSIGDLAALKTLTLSCTPLETVPDSICKLLHLSHLDLGYTKLNGLPNAMGELVALKIMSVSSYHSLRVWSESPRLPSCLQELTIDLSIFLEKPAVSFESVEVGSQEEEIVPAMRDWESQLRLQSLLSQLPFLPALSTLELFGWGFPQHWLQPLFYTLQQISSLKRLSLNYFNLVETIPCGLGLLSRLVRLDFFDFERLPRVAQVRG